MKDQPMKSANTNTTPPLPFGLKLSPIAFGWTLALFAIFFFSMATPIARGLIVAGAAPVGIIVVRLSIATALHCATLLVTAPEMLRPDLRGLVIALGIGLVNGFGMVLYFLALTRLDASITAMLIATSPLAVLSLLALGGEKLTRRHGVRMVLALTGVYLLIGPGGQVDMVGVAMALAAVLCFSSQLVVVQWYLKEQDARTITFFTNLGMLLIVAIIWVVQGMAWAPLSNLGWTSIIVLAVFSTFISRWAMYSSVTYIGSAQMSMLTPLEILLAVIWSILFLHERLSLMHWVGGILILSSALLAIQRLNLAQHRMRWRTWIRS
jgi:drug/metabolite transporter (DMT)-like permease